MSELIGRTLGQYQIIEQIGKGGMATVYRAYQPSLNRYIALKVLSPIHAREEPDFNERFRREAESIANLRHPNILPVYDFGHEQDYSYIAMAYVEGARTLREVMAELLSLSQVADLIGQIAAALDCAHQQKVIHRDVKPSNVLMDGDWALLTDFGLAKMTEASVKLTGSGVGVGTPAYMSPEQAQGVEIDCRTDVYSLGIVLFEMLTGQIPHSAETPLAIVLKRITEPLPIPHTINPDIPEAVERVILKALAREPVDRFASAGAMADALKVAVSEPAVAEAEEPSLGYLEVEPWPAEEESAAIEPEAPAPVRRAFPWKGVGGIGAVAVVSVLCVVVVVVAFMSRDWLTATFGPVVLAPTATFTVPAPTDTPLPISTSTSLPSLTSTAIPVPIDTPKPSTPTSTDTATPTSMSTPTSTPSPTSTSTRIPTNTPSPTPTRIPPPAMGELGDTWTRPMDGMVMVYVPAGEFWMGSYDRDPDAYEDEKPRHKVYVDAFWIDRTEVTNAQYKKCVDAGACSPSFESGSYTRDSYYGNPEYDDYPVSVRNLDQTREYAEWVGGRLPTEAEWEYAARGPDGNIYPWGNGAPDGSLLNYNGNVGDTTAVGLYPDGASWCGALDMAGNVWEWTQSLHQEYPYDPTDGREDLDASGLRVLRGGSFLDSAKYVRCAYRVAVDPVRGHGFDGIRVVVVSPD